MSEIIAEKIELPAWPDLEDFMAFSHENRIDGDCMNALLELWQEWITVLKACRISDGKKSWLAVWLPEEVEKEVDARWASSPSQAFLINALAQFICMSAIQEKLPPVAAGGCAPAPEPDLALKEGLAAAGLEADEESGILKRRYAIVTWFPFRGGCEVCSLRENCPKGSGKSDFTNFLLPGHEEGRQA